MPTVDRGGFRLSMLSAARGAAEAQHTMPPPTPNRRPTAAQMLPGCCVAAAHLLPACWLRAVLGGWARPGRRL